MKRLVIAAMVLALIGTFAFADGPVAKWSIGTWTGMGILTSLDANVGTGLSLVQYDYNWVGGSAYRIGLTYTAADGNAGFNSRLQVGSPLTAAINVSAGAQLNAWGKMFNGLLTVRGGILDDYTIATKDWYCYGNTDGSFGLYVNLTPVEGLDIGYFQGVPYATVDSSAIMAPNAVSSIFGAQYTMKDTLNAELGLIAPSTGSDVSKVYLGAKLLAVKDLTAILEGKIGFDGSMNFLENLGYTMGPLNIMSRIGENIGTDGTFNYGVEPIVTYTASDMVKLSLIGNYYTDKGQSWMAPQDGGVWGSIAANIGGGGVGVFATIAQSGASLIIGDYVGTGNSLGNLVWVNIDLSL